MEIGINIIIDTPVSPIKIPNTCLLFNLSPKNRYENIDTNKRVHTDFINNVIDTFSTSFNRYTNDRVPTKNVRATAIIKCRNAFLLLFSLNFLPFTIKIKSKPIDTIKNTSDFMNRELRGLVK